MKPDLSLPMAFLFLVGAGCSGAPADTAGLSVSGPHGHGNLQVWLVHGPDRATTGELVPLHDALARGLVKVHETGTVEELAIENVDPAVRVFVQAGDIVRGGDQDRTIGADLVFEPASGRQPLPSFCVEQGRWSRRSGEGSGGACGTAAMAMFADASNHVPTLELKRALLCCDQDKVWSEVENVQCMLAANVGQVVDASSPTSLELTLDMPAVRAATEAFERALRGIIEGRDDVVGCVIAIDGRLQSADLYGSQSLLKSLWPKLLRAAATAAVAGQTEVSNCAAPPTAREVLAFLAAPDSTEVREVHGSVTQTVGETAAAQVIESRSDQALLHRACLAK